MNKKVVIKLLKNNQVNQEEFLTFIIDYLEFKKKPTPTVRQLQVMLQLFDMGIFQVNDAIMEAARHLKLQLITITKGQTLIRTDVYEY